MTDKTDPELALAVARVMGKDACLKDGECWLVEDHYVRPRLSSVWRPDLGGAAGAEMLEWMFLRSMIRLEPDIYEDDTPKHYWCLLTPFDSDEQYEAYGPTIWIALCSAIVAWGGGEMNGSWNVIETCPPPKNRTVLLFAWSEALDNRRMETGYWARAYEDDEERQPYNWGGRQLYLWEQSPTHWLPLPPAPEPPK